MKQLNMMVMVLFLTCFADGAANTSEAATNFNGSTITGIDHGQRTITFKTREGESWTLPVADPEIFKKQQITQGDNVSIEIDLNDRITKILKTSGSGPSAPSSAMRDDSGQ
jgi:hypothetical protein